MIKENSTKYNIVIGIFYPRSEDDDIDYYEEEKVHEQNETRLSSCEE